MPLITYFKTFRWDSSDPERAPPPLPLNPGSPNVSTRANTSANIVAAAQVLQDKARESNGPSPYTTNPMPSAGQKSPERSLIKGGAGGASASRNRLQSLSTPSVKDLRSHLDGARTPTERSPERRMGTPTRGNKDMDRELGMSGSPEKAHPRHSTPTPMPSGRDLVREGSALLRQGGGGGGGGGRNTPKALFGENIPPGQNGLSTTAATASSSALVQTKPNKDMDGLFGPVANVSASTSTTTTSINPKALPSFDVISSQISSLTNIATNLQREMSQLSRRSKDNASDLISLKEATHRRDEDIRLSLRELVASVSDVPMHQYQHLLTASPAHSPVRGAARPSSSLSFLDSKLAPHSPPSAGKSISLPRIPSPNSFLMENERGSPSPYSVEGAASVAMLEKIIREMVTKDGQERLLSNLSQLLDKYGKESVDKSVNTAAKVEELADFIKCQSQALVHRGSVADAADGSSHVNSAQAGPLAKISRKLKAGGAGPSAAGAATSEGPKAYSSPKAADFVSAEMLKLLKKIKDSVAESGGMTAEVKALVRDLRSEVLGMGRELGRKIDEAERPGGDDVGRGVERGEAQSMEVARIVQEGIEEMREQMDKVIREKRRQSSASSVVSRSAVDAEEVYGVVKHALAEHDFTYGGALQIAQKNSNDSSNNNNTNIDVARALEAQKEEILAAVKEAYEAYKPEIELQQFGLEREEILQCLREGLEDYRSSNEVSRGQQSNDGSSISREEIMNAVQEAMQNFTPPPAAAAPSTEVHEVREEVLLAVRDCLEDYGLPAKSRHRSVSDASNDNNNNKSQDLAHTTAVILNAVQEAFIQHGPSAPRELEISREDLFEAVRAGLESSTEPLGPSGEKILSPLHGLVEEMRVEFKQYSAANGRDTEQVLDAVKDGLESLRAEIESYVDRAQDVTGKDEIVDTMRTGLVQLREDVRGFIATGNQQHDGADVVNYIKAEFEHMHESLSAQIAPAADLAGAKEELVQAVQAGMEELKRQMLDRAHDGGRGGIDGAGVAEDIADDVAEAMKDEFDQLRAAILNGSSAHKDEVMEAIQESIQNLQLSVGGGDMNRSIGPAADSGEIVATMRDEFAHLRDTLATSVVPSAGGAGANVTAEAHAEATAANSEALEAIRNSVDGLRSQFAADQSENAGQLQSAIREELEHLREMLSSTIVRGGGVGGGESSVFGSGNELEIKEELEALRIALEGIRGGGAASVGVGAGTEQTAMLSSIKDELEHLRQSIASAMLQQNTSRADTEEILETVRLGLDDLRSHLEKRLDNPEKQMSATNEIIDALTDGLDGLRADIPRSVAGAESQVGSTLSSEVVGALKDDISSIRDDIRHLRAVESERDEGGASFLSGNEVVLADAETSKKNKKEQQQRSFGEGMSGEVASTEMLRRNDLEKMEVMMAQLQIKVEAMDQNILNPPTVVPTTGPDVLPTSTSAATGGDGSTSAEVRENLSSIETLLKDVQSTIDVVAQREVGSDVARKEDTDAIETLLRNTKSRLEEMDLPEGAAFALKDNLEMVETVVRTTQDSLRELSDRLDGSGATKNDIAVVEVLAQDMKTALEEIKDEQTRLAAASEGEKLEKADLDVLGILCTEIKNKVADIAFPDADDVPSKADLEQLKGLVHDFRESHDRLKDSYETDIAVTAKAFDDRKQEAKDLAENVEHVKIFLEELKDSFQTKLEGGKPFDEIKEMVKGLDDTIGGHFNITTDVKELFETVTREFERAHGSIDLLKVDQEERAAVLLDKHDEASTSVITEVNLRMDDHFNALMTKYDDAQVAATAQVKATEERALQQEELMTGTKAMAEDLKVTIDTLGTSVLGLGSTFTEATDKISDDSKTVFSKVEDVFARLDEAREKMDATHDKIEGASIDNKTEHRLTRDELSRALVTLGTIQGDVADFHPRFADTLKDVLTLVTQHYEHSQKSQEQALEQNRIAAEESKAHVEEIKSTFSDLPALLPPPPTPPAPVEHVDRYDDSVVQEKIDKLASQAAESHRSLEQLQRLDDIHQRVVDTAAEVAGFVTMQTRLITEGHESREKEAAEQAVLLERRKAEREQLESEITTLRLDKGGLSNSVTDLKAETETLAAQKMRLTADVSALQTALAIRREELNVMEGKANALERRILDGIMDHSRALMIARSATAASAAQPVGMKKQKPFQRGVSAASNATVTKSFNSGDSNDTSANKTVTTPSKQQQQQRTVPSPAANTLNLALKTRAANKTHNGNSGSRRSLAAPTSNSPANRRILSLSQITHNVPTGGAAAGLGGAVGTYGHGYGNNHAGAGAGSGLSNGNGYNTFNSMLGNSMKRSQSVRNVLPRKSSWAGRRNASITSAKAAATAAAVEEEDGEDKENMAQDQMRDAGDAGDDDDDVFSDTGTERRTSGTRTLMSGVTGSSYVTNTGTGTSIDDTTEPSVRSRSRAGSSASGSTATETATEIETGTATTGSRMADDTASMDSRSTYLAGSELTHSTDRSGTAGSTDDALSSRPALSSSASYMTGTVSDLDTGTRLSYGSTARSVLGRESILEEDEDEDERDEHDTEAAHDDDKSTSGDATEDVDDEVDAIDFTTPNEYNQADVEDHDSSASPHNNNITDYNNARPATQDRKDDTVDDDDRDSIEEGFNETIDVSHHHDHDHDDDDEDLDPPPAVNIDSAAEDTAAEEEEGDDEVAPLQYLHAKRDPGVPSYDGHGYDSGLGSDLPTAALSPSVAEGEFFGR